MMRNLLALLTLFFLITGGKLFSQNTDHKPGIYKFIENGGQWTEGVLYRADVDAGSIWLDRGGILYQFKDYSDLHDAHFGHESNDNPKIEQYLIYAKFLGSNEDINVSHKYPTTEYYNYFLGNDESKWASNLHGYNHITYNGIYNDIDLLILEKDNELKYEFHVAPNANPDQIKIKYIGYDKIKLKGDGNIVIKTELGELIEQSPYTYQIKNGKIVEIESEFILNDSILTYRLGEYDESIELIIDPILVFATYSGSPTDNFGMTATYAYDGKAYSGGTTYGNSYPTPGPAWNTTATITELNAQANDAIVYGITDVFISKYSEDGTTMIWTNFIGGGSSFDGTETVHSLICDTLNNLYLYGATSSIDFPMMNAYQPNHAGGTANSNFYYNGVYYYTQGTDIYVSKFSEDGMSLLGSTYVGGSANDGVNYRIAGGIYNSVASYDSLTFNYGDQFRGEIMLDSMNNIYIASCSRSGDFPVLNSVQNVLGGQQDGVIFKLSADFSNLLWASFYGGSANDACYSVKLDSSYNILFAGGTCSSNLIGTTGGINPTYLGGKTDGFVVKLTPDGSTLTQATYIGTSGNDQTIFVETDRYDNVYIVGNTDGAMPVINAPYSNPNSGQYIQKLTPDLTAITYATVFGNGSGIPNISPSAFLVDVCGNVYVSGWGANILQATPISGMPVTPDAYQLTPPSGFDFYLIVLEREMQSLLYGTYMGGVVAQEHVDGGTSRFDKFGIVYQSVCGGCGNNSDFPTTSGAWSNTNDSNNCNNVLFKFDFEIIPEAEFTSSQYEGCVPLTLIFDNASNDTVNFTWTFPPEATVISGGVNPEVVFTDTGTFIITLTIFDTICNLMDTAQKVIVVHEQNELLVTDDIFFCSGDSFDLIANSFGTATAFIWALDTSFAIPLNSSAMDSTINVSPTISTTYYVTSSNGWPSCDLIDSVQVIYIDDGIDVMSDTSICTGNPVNLYANNIYPGVNITWDWSPDSSLTSETNNTATATPLVSTWYYVTATTDLGCVYSDSVWVEVNGIDPSTVFATATPDTVVQGNATVLEAFPIGYNYSWSPTVFLSDPLAQSTAAVVFEDTYYEVTITDGPCSYKTGVTVYTLEFICGDIYIYIPNAFSPNDDGVNDFVFVRGLNIVEMDFKIFDRWGELVFQTNDQTVGWDGTFKGNLVDPDVYVYHLQVTCIGGDENLIKGNITLLK